MSKISSYQKLKNKFKELLEEIGKLEETNDDFGIVIIQKIKENQELEESIIEKDEEIEKIEEKLELLEEKYEIVKAAANTNKKEVKVL